MLDIHRQERRQWLADFEREAQFQKREEIFLGVAGLALLVTGMWALLTFLSA